jgi:hypothetical protein
MALETRHLVGGVLLALAIGAGVAWTQRQPAEPRQASPAEPAASTAPADTGPVLYKWQDDGGVWNYTDQPPADRPFERITGTPNVNSVPTVVPDSGLVEPSAPPAQ